MNFAYYKSTEDKNEYSIRLLNNKNRVVYPTEIANLLNIQIWNYENILIDHGGERKTRLMDDGWEYQYISFSKEQAIEAVRTLNEKYATLLAILYTTYIK